MLALGGMRRVENVVVLRPCERLHHDGSAVAAIYRRFGPVSGEQVIRRAMAELALTLSEAVAQIAAHDLAGLPRPLRRVQRLAGHLGLPLLERVAADAQHCLAVGDATGFAAVWARVLRVAAVCLPAAARR